MSVQVTGRCARSRAGRRGWASNSRSPPTSPSPRPMRASRPAASLAGSRPDIGSRPGCCTPRIVGLARTKQLPCMLLRPEASTFLAPPPKEMGARSTQAVPSAQGFGTEVAEARSFRPARSPPAPPSPWAHQGVRPQWADDARSARTMAKEGTGARAVVADRRLPPEGMSAFAQRRPTRTSKVDDVDVLEILHDHTTSRPRDKSRRSR